MDERISTEIDNDIAQIACVIELLERSGRLHSLPETAVFHMTLALDELLTNIISYGFLDGGRHKITAWIGLCGNRLEAEIVDDGIAFDPLVGTAPDVGLSIEEREIGGLGVHLIRSMMDHVDYRRADGHNYLKLIKSVRGDPTRRE